MTLSDLERSKPRSPRFQSLISRKGAMLRHLLLLTISVKPYIGSPMEPLHFTRVTLTVKVKVTKIVSGRRSDWYTYICQKFMITTLTWMSHKVICWQRGFPLSQWSFLFLFCSHSAFISFLIYTVPNTVEQTQQAKKASYQL